MVIGITGKKRSGKDTLADYLVEKGFIKIELARPLKDWLKKVNPVLNPPKKFSTLIKYIYISIVKKRIPRYLDVVEYLDQDLVKDEFSDVRKLLQITGTDLVREYNEDFWVDIVLNTIKNGPIGSNYVISDVRFDNEVIKLSSVNCDNGGVFKVIKVIRPNLDVSDLTSTHQSENGVSTGLIDFVIYNDSTILNMTSSLDSYLKINSGNMS